MAKEKELMVPLSNESLAALKSEFPQEDSYQAVFLPRLSMVSQDKTEGKGKTLKVVTEAGTFFTEVQLDELDDEGKKIWEKSEIGSALEGIILYQRKQLKYFDEATETYTSSPVFDTDDEVIPLFANKAEIARGTSKELRARPEYAFEKDGKVRSKLEENRILYVEHEGVVYQLNLRGSSMFAYLTYVRELGKQGMVPPAVVTRFSSEAKEKGSIAWNQMTFVPARTITEQEAERVRAATTAIKQGIDEQKRFFASKSNEF